LQILYRSAVSRTDPVKSGTRGPDLPNRELHDERIRHNDPEIPSPERRRLRAFAFDPMSSRLSGRFLNVDIKYEPNLLPGPNGELVQVVDFDGTRGTWYRPVDLDDPLILAEHGLRPSESDPRTHQQIVYAIAMSVIEQFERYLGRRFRWKEERKLLLVPHAFEERNAYYSPDRLAILFGYYAANLEDPGANLPGQVMFTCLSVDVIAHEMTHAMVHRVRPYYSDATNRDVRAWDEAFADLVALFHHFAYREVVESAIAGARADLRDKKHGGLLDLAREFGESTGLGHGKALRSALSMDPSPREFEQALEPHKRGSHFVAAIFDAYLEVYQSRIADLLRIASGGSGVLPAGNLLSDLVSRAADEAVKNADRFLGMVIRALDYLPVVDVTFGDVVRAIVTADRRLFPADRYNLRSTLVEALRRHGIHPRGIASLADEALEWTSPENSLTLAEGSPHMDLSEIVWSATLDLDLSGVPGSVTYYFDQDSKTLKQTAKKSGRKISSRIRKNLRKWARNHSVELGLNPNNEFNIHLQGLHVAHRQAADRQPLPEIILQFVQRREDLEKEHGIGLPLIAGATLVAQVDGRILYVITKPLPMCDEDLSDLGEKHREMAEQHRRVGCLRLAEMESWKGLAAATNALSPFEHETAVSGLSLARLHAGRHPADW
jgi:hypothetical protein